MKKQFVDLILIFFVLTVFVGCAGVRLVEDRKQAPEGNHTEDYSYSYYIPFVRYTTTPVDMDSVCRQKQWKDVYLSPNVLGGLISVFTIGIVEPQKIEATCFN